MTCNAYTLNNFVLNRNNVTIKNPNHCLVSLPVPGREQLFPSLFHKLKTCPRLEQPLSASSTRGGVLRKSVGSESLSLRRPPPPLSPILRLRVSVCQ